MVCDSVPNEYAFLLDWQILLATRLSWKSPDGVQTAAPFDSATILVSQHIESDAQAQTVFDTLAALMNLVTVSIWRRRAALTLTRATSGGRTRSR